VKPTASLRRRAPRALALVVLATLLPGCATTTGSGATRVFCGAAQPIRWSAADSDETIRQARAHNAVGRRLCGWR